MNVHLTVLYVITIYTTFILFPLINEVVCKSEIAEDGPCKEKFIENVNATDRLNKTWYLVYLKTLDKYNSAYLDNTPKCGITSHGEFCTATAITFFNGTDFYVLGINEELGAARVVHANYTRDSDKYAIFKMQYKNSWVQEQNGTSRLSELPEKDRDQFNSSFALIQIDINDRFAFVGRCPNFDIAFIMVDPKYYNDFLHTHFDFNVEEGTRAGRAFNDLPFITEWIRFQKEFPDGYETLKLPDELKPLSSNDSRSDSDSKPSTVSIENSKVITEFSVSTSDHQESKAVSSKNLDSKPKSNENSQSYIRSQLSSSTKLPESKD